MTQIKITLSQTFFHVMDQHLCLKVRFTMTSSRLISSRQVLFSSFLLPPPILLHHFPSLPFPFLSLLSVSLLLHLSIPLISVSPSIHPSSTSPSTFGALGKIYHQHLSVICYCLLSLSHSLSLSLSFSYPSHYFPLPPFFPPPPSPLCLSLPSPHSLAVRRLIVPPVYLGFFILI